MPTTTDGLGDGDCGAGAPLAEMMAERCADPEWHSLRLFGQGRHRDVFAGEFETRDEL